MENLVLKNSIKKDLLHTKRYILFWFSSLFSNIGTWMQQVAQPWLILSTGHSSFWVGLDSFLMNAPAWIFTLPGGFLADRFDRKKIVLLCQSLQFICILSLLIFLIVGKIKIWIILVSSLIIGITDSLSMPAFQSIIPSLVAKERLSKAVALNSIQFNLSRILGPGFAGVLIAAYGVAICYGINLLSFVPFFMSLYFIYPKYKIKEKMITASSKKNSTKSEFKELIDGHNNLAPLLTVLVTGIFCGPILTFCPSMVKEFFHGGIREIGWSMTSFGLGGVIGGIMASAVINKMSESDFFPNIVALILTVIVFFLNWSTTLFVFNIFLFMIGMFLTLTNISCNTNLQKRILDSSRGKIVSLFQMALHTGISVGSLLTGTLSVHFGIKSTIIINGTLAFITQAFLIYFRYRRGDNG